MNRLIGAVFVLCLALIAPVRADNVDRYLTDALQKEHIPGLSLAVVKKGRIIKTKGYGLANLELRVPAASKTVYEIGSMTKQFTAVAILMLVEENKIGLDDKIGKYLTGLPGEWEEVTVRHLLNHTSGIREYFDEVSFLEFSRSEHTAEEIVKKASESPPAFAPGAKWAYSSTGYYLLGMIIEKISGKSYWGFLSDRIFRPLGMASTRDSDPGTIIPGRASGYAWTKDTFVNCAPITSTAGWAAGSLVSTAPDLAKWDAALYTEKIIHRGSFQQMRTPVVFGDVSYGFGWRIGEQQGRKFMEHGGSTAGFTSFIIRYPEEQLTVIVLTNRQVADAPSLAKWVAAFYLPARRPD